MDSTLGESACLAGLACTTWNPSAQSDDSKSEQVKHCIHLQHSLHWLHLEPTHLSLPHHHPLQYGPRRKLRKPSRTVQPLTTGGTSTEALGDFACSRQRSIVTIS
jgi:hypothetical protein